MGSTGPLLIVILIVLLPVILLLSNKMRTKGKCLCFFMEGDLPVVPKLLKVVDDEFVTYDGGKYNIYEKACRIFYYPMGWPSILQERVPCALYRVGDGIPRNWVDLTERKVSSRELGSILDPHWLGMIVKGWQKEAGGGDRLQRLLPLMMVALGALTLIMTFVIMTKFGSIQSAVNALK